MSKKPWRNINDLGFSFGNKAQKEKPKTKVVDLDEETTAPQKDEPEVKLSNGVFIEGADGFLFNKKCTIRVDAEILKETPRKRVTFETFVVFDGEEENLGQQVEGYINDEGHAEAEMMLYYGDKYAKTLHEDPTAKCFYKFKASHTKGANVLDSDVLKMPYVKKRAVIILKVEDALFRHNSAAFLPDSNYRDDTGTDKQENICGISVIKAILNRAYKYKEQKVLIAGHTDRSGPDDYNFKLSKMRADSLLFLILNSRDDWVAIVNDKNVEKDIQHLLKWAAQFKSWNCDPGKVDGVIGQNTKKAIKNFQKAADLVDDGIFGKKTWGRVFDLYQEKLTSIMEGTQDEKDALSNRNTINWAYDIKSVGCGELWPKTSEMKSQTDRRVEVLFFEENELPEWVCKDGMCTKEECKIYPDGLFERSYISIGGSAMGNLKIQHVNKQGGVTIEISGPEVRTGKTDPNGEITFLNVKVGDYTVRVV